MSSGETVEQEIQRKGLTAPRVTLQMVEQAIAGETYTVLPSGRTTICELTLQNGFTVRGESSCVSIENFDAALGQRVARDDAKRTVWVLLAYALREKLAAPPRVIHNADHLQYEIDNANTPPEQRADWPLTSFDARDWANAFNKRHPEIAADDALAWFACSLMTGYDRGRVTVDER